MASLFKYVDKTWRDRLLSDEYKEVTAAAITAFSGLTNYTPTESLILRALELPLDQTRVIAIGQDPYTKKGMAIGLAFGNSVRIVSGRSSAIISPSLRNIMNATGCEDPTLGSWQGQGIMLINTVLTATADGQPCEAIHKFWLPLTTAIVTIAAQTHRDKICFILWGNHAQSTFIPIASKYGCYIATWTHPSPTADNMLADDRKFVNCTNFASVNAQLIAIGRGPAIVWNSKMFMYNWPTYLAFTDGACFNNGKLSAKASYAYVVLRRRPVAGPALYEVVAGKASKLPLTEEQTNNRGELSGILYALEAIVKLHNNNTILPRVGLVTDSGYAINIINRANVAHKNTDLIDAIFEQEAQMRLTLKHINSHTTQGISCRTDKPLAPMTNYDNFMTWWNDYVDLQATNA